MPWWELLESGLVEDAPLSDPRQYAAIRSTIDPYEVLGIDHEAPVEAVKAAYHRLARTHHPDRGGDRDAFQRICAAHDALIGASLSALPFGGAMCPSRSESNAARKDIVRCILVAPNASSSNICVSHPRPTFWLTLDEKQVLVLTRETRNVAVTADADSTLLCCCFLDDARRLAVGGTQGLLLIATLQHGPERPPEPVALPLSTRGPLLAVCAPPGDQSPLLCASVDGRVVLLNVDACCELCSFDAFGLHAEALLCPLVPELEDEEVFPPEPIVFVGGSGAADAGSEAGAAGKLCCLRLGAACADGEADAVLTLWTSEYDAPVFALAVSPVATEDPAAPANPTLLAVAARSVVALHDASTGAALRRLVAGEGVLYALAFSPR